MNVGLPAVLCLMVFTYAPKAFTQSGTEDSLLRRSAYLRTAAIYQDQIGDQSSLNNGTRYEKYPYPFRLGTAYYPSDAYLPGQVVYDGVSFDSVLLLYDALQQVLVALKDGYSLQLISEKISSFNIAGHLFVRMMADSAESGIPATRFYEILYPGNSRVIKLIRKNIHEEVFSTEGIPRYMVAEDEYYVRRKNRFMRVKFMSDLPDIFLDHKKEVKRFIEKNNFQQENLEMNLVRVAGFYDQLVQ
jgi:hypothetical protein